MIRMRIENIDVQFIVIQMSIDSLRSRMLFFLTEYENAEY